MTQAAQQQPRTATPDTNHPHAAPEEVLSVDFIALAQIFYLRRKTIALVAFAFLLSAALAAFLIPPSYTATAAFVPPSSGSSASAATIAGQLSSVLGAGALGGVKSTGDLYVGILKSRTIAATLVQRFGLKAIYKANKESEAEKSLAAHTVFDLGIKDSIVTVSVTDHSPERARDLANGYLNALKSTSGGLALTESSQRRLFYESRLAQEKDELAGAEIALKQTQEKTGLVAPAGQTAAEIQAIAQMRAQISGREVRLAALRSGATDQNPEVVSLQTEIASLQSHLATMENGKTSTHLGDPSTAQLPALELDYIRKARDVKYHETLFEIIAKQYEVARLDEANSIPLQILDPAIAPDTKSGPPRLLILLGGLIGGFACGCFWVLFLATQIFATTWHRIRSPESTTRTPATPGRSAGRNRMTAKGPA